MKIIVCIKQVPATASVKIDPVTLQLIREGVENVLNPFDCHALEAALALKETEGAEVIALSMGPARAEAVLREALAMGCDRAVLLSDRAFAGSDTWATGYLLKLAVEKIGGVDLIVCGKQAIDGDTAQIGPELAAQLGIMQALGISALKWSAGDGTLLLRRQTDAGYDRIRLALPAVLGVERELNTPRIPTLLGYMHAEHAPVTVWNAADLEPESAWVGLNGSPTRVAASRPAELRRRHTTVIRREAAYAANELARMLEAELSNGKGRD